MDAGDTLLAIEVRKSPPDRSGKDSWRRSAGFATGRLYGDWRARSPSRPIRAAGAARRALADGTPAARRETARREKIKDKKQSERFKEAARALGADQDGEQLERLVKEMARMKPVAPEKK